MNKHISNIISYLRFPLIVGVVFIHSKLDSLISVDASSYTFFVMSLFSDVIARLCVPLFFFFSGYLFFINVEFNKLIYREKLKKRIRTVLTPYLIWNCFGFIVLLIKVHPYFSVRFPALQVYHVDIESFLRSFWSFSLVSNNSYYPINFPLWYLRDLFILILFSPFVYRLICALKYSVVFILFVIWFSPLGGHEFSQSLAFFPLGAYLSINKYDFDTILKRFSPYSIVMYVIIAVLDVLTIGEQIHFLIHQIGILVGMIAIINLVSCLLQNRVFMSIVHYVDVVFLFSLPMVCLFQSIRNYYCYSYLHIVNGR